MSRLNKPVGPGDHVLGRPDAPVTLLEYGDYECPFSGSAHPVVAEVLHRSGSDVRFVFRPFPLAQVHPRALMAAEAAEAAGQQGAFWPMHARLFENQDALELDDLLVYARWQGLDMGRFSGELRSRIHAPVVEEAFFSGVRSGVRGTPTFFVNGAELGAPWSAETLVEAVLAEHAGRQAP
jgi:protein-disulfide isomerase